MPLARQCPAGTIALCLACLSGTLAVAPAVSAQQPVVVAATAAPTAAVAPDFAEWLAGLRAEALARGIAQKTVDEALGDVAPLPVVVERDRTQAELTLTLDQYLKRRLPRRFVQQARKVALTQRGLLKRVDEAYGVPPSVLTAVWGLESNFGRFSGVRPTIPTLATLAHEGRRAAMFRDELFAALTIVDRGDAPLAQLRGSWAGAMGQPQFMPSTYLNDAVDFDKDGRRDIWQSTPDVLASIGRYLQARGWTRGQRWGREVSIPDHAAAKVSAGVPLRLSGACQAIREMSEPRPLQEWKFLGVRLKGGGPLPASTVPASLVRVDRHVFLVYANYEALLAYNCAHTYALSVATLADRLGTR
jgi:membrane-bound lytic murein transglycosylase B